MNGETWPKEEQRLCNGASGQVPVTAVDGYEATIPPQIQAEVNAAVDVADSMAAQAMDYARNEIGHYVSTAHTENVVRLAAAHMECASRVYASRLHVEALREVGIENAGAIDSGFTVLGAGLAEGLQGAGKGRTCRRPT